MDRIQFLKNHPLLKRSRETNEYYYFRLENYDEGTSFNIRIAKKENAMAKWAYGYLGVAFDEANWSTHDPSVLPQYCQEILKRLSL